MEERFAHDFSDVRVHSGPQAAESAEALHARAYAVGNHLVFGHGRYAPTTSDGQVLLAHELTHVVQQRRGGHVPRRATAASLERDASRVAADISRGTPFVAVAERSGLGVARAEEFQIPPELARMLTPQDIAKLKGFGEADFRESIRTLQETFTKTKGFTREGAPHQYKDIRQAAGELNVYMDYVRRPEVVAIKVVPHAEGGRSPDMYARYRGKGGVLTEGRVEVKNVTLSSPDLRPDAKVTEGGRVAPRVEQSEVEPGVTRLFKGTTTEFKYSQIKSAIREKLTPKKKSTGELSPTQLDEVGPNTLVEGRQMATGGDIVIEVHGHGEVEARPLENIIKDLKSLLDNSSAKRVVISAFERPDPNVAPKDANPVRKFFEFTREGGNWNLNVRDPFYRATAPAVTPPATPGGTPAPTPAPPTPTPKTETPSGAEAKPPAGEAASPKATAPAADAAAKADTASKAEAGKADAASPKAEAGSSKPTEGGSLKPGDAKGTAAGPKPAADVAPGTGAAPRPGAVRPGLGARTVAGGMRAATFVAGEARMWIGGFFTPQNLAFMIVDMAIQHWIEERERKLAQDAIAAKLTSSRAIQQQVLEEVTKKRDAIARAQFGGGKYYVHVNFRVPAVNKTVRDVQFSNVTSSDHPENRWECTVMSHGVPFFGSMSEEEICYITTSAELPPLKLGKAESVQLKIEQLEEREREAALKSEDPAEAAKRADEITRLRASLPGAETEDERMAAAEERAKTAELGRASVSGDAKKRADEQRQIVAKLQQLPAQKKDEAPKPAAAPPPAAPGTSLIPPAPSAGWSPLGAGAPTGPSNTQTANAANAEADRYVGWAQSLEQRMIANQSAAETTRKALVDEEIRWHWEVKLRVNAYHEKSMLHEAYNKLGTLLDRTGPKLRNLRQALGGPAEP